MLLIVLLVLLIKLPSGFGWLETPGGGVVASWKGGGGTLGKRKKKNAKNREQTVQVNGQVAPTSPNEFIYHGV